MDEYLYRYISFESFVGMIQSQSLTFVLPELWDDPKESAPFYELLSTTEAAVERIMLYSIYNKTFGQCWTRLSESDAMWRIYSYNNRAVKIKVAVSNLELLPDIKIIPVEYGDRIKIDPNKGTESFYRALAFKRLAFQHESEVRLIKNYKFTSEEDFDTHIKAVLALSEHEDKLEIIDSMYPDLSFEDKVREIIRLLNVGNNRTETIEVTFKEIPQFFAGISVHPMAPEWYVNIVGEYCARNDLPFEGKSMLYS